jgi:Spy/CpxP family protein refolding chaperone
MALLTVIGAGLGGWFGVRYGLDHAPHETNLDTVLHERLDLTAGQDHRIKTLEVHFAKQRKAFEVEIRSANRDLGTILAPQHVYNADARRAVDRFHRAMRALQDATIMHVLAMRAVLTPKQAKIFDQSVRQSLDSPSS